MKFCQCVTSLYPHILTNLGRFILIFNKIELIFLGVLIVSNVSRFDFYQVKLPRLHRQGWVTHSSPDLKPLDYQVWEMLVFLLQAATEAKTVPKFTDAL